jgi:hypothetical protein
MTIRYKFGLPFILLLAFSFLVFGLLTEDTDSTLTQDEEWELPPRMDGPGADRRASMERGRAREVLGTTGLRLSAQVVDRITSEPVIRFDLMLKGRDRSGRPFETLRETINNEEGRFSLPLEGAGIFSLSVKAAGYVREYIKDLRVPSGKALTVLRIALDPVRSLAGRVVDRSTGLPIEGALVVAEALGRASSYGYEEGIITGEGGRFRLTGLRKTRYRITACHEDYEEGSVEAEPPDTDVLVPLVKTLEFRVYGMVLDDEGRPAAGIRITLKSQSVAFDQYALTDEEGRYATPNMPPGWVRVIAERSGSTGDRPVEFTQESRYVHLVDRNVEADFGPGSEHAAWQGIFHDWDGKPVSRGRLWVYLESPLNESGMQSIDRKAVCDEQGRFKVVKLIPGVYRVYLTFPERYGPVRSEEDGRRYIRLLEPEYKDYDWGTLSIERPGIVKKDIRVSGAELAGVVVCEGDDRDVRGAHPKVMALGRAPPWKTYIIHANYEGRFHLRGLAPGLYGLSVGNAICAQGYHDDVRVEAGQVIEDLRLVLPEAGSLEVHLNVSEKVEPRIFTVKLENVNEDRSYHLGSFIYPERGWWWKEYEVKRGSWQLVIEGEGVGRIERPFEMRAPWEVGLDIQMK